MPAYTFHPTLLLRAPVYSYNFYSDQNLQLVLKQPFFQKAIYFSSEVFYDELKKCDFELDKLEKKAVDTLKKYFNRMCFRPTPFGICSAFGAVQWGNINEITFTDTALHPHIQLSYAKGAAYATDLLHAHEDNATYDLNSTLYKAGTEYRFLKQNHDNAQVEFVIDSLKTNTFFNKLLKYLRGAFTKTKIAAFVCEQAGCTTDEADNYVQWLIDGQIISNTLEANITGEDHLQRLAKTGASESIKPVLNALQSIRKPADLENIHPGEGDLKSNDYYVNLEAKFNKGALDTSYQQQITEAFNCLNLLTTNQQAAGLSDFIKNFSQKFDGQTIPLLTAIDPELGIGYSNLAVEENDVNIVNINNPATTSNPTINWTDAHALFFNKWKTAGNNNIITLTVDDLKGIKPVAANLPPTLSVMFRIVDEKVLIETAGGTSACALVGRFTPFDTQIEALARDMAQKESQYNPDIIFAEIAHICHNKTANIDRREHIYPYEVPVLVQSTLPKEQQILLNDLWVSVVDGQIILQSKTHNKRVVPRLSSAFNYTRNDLAVFRFLCDLQRATLKTGFNLSLNQFFPGLSFYPRVEYKNTILHLAYWNLKKDDLAEIAKADTANKQTLFKAFAQQKSLPQYIALTQNDHQLVFDLDKPDDVLFFLDTVKGMPQFTIKEYLLPSSVNPVVVGDNKQPHVNQFIASLYHQQQVYKPFVKPITTTKQPRTFIPGSEWLYLKLYCHPIRSNELLHNCVSSIVKKLSTQKLISQWFYIRYADPGYHIRLRLKADLKDHQQILNLLHQTIDKYTSNGQASNYSIATYEREMERYSPQFMNEFEHTFYTSSNFVTAFLKQHNAAVSAKDILEFAVASISDMVAALGLEGKALLNFLDRVSGSFANEFIAISDLKYQLDTEYRKHKPIIEAVLQNQDEYYKDLGLTKARMLFIKSLSELKQTIESKATWRDKWVSDLVHMHLNRLFINDSRKQEMAVYYFLSKYQRSAQARLAKPLIKIDN